jgi:hypothetical protein
MARTSSAMTKKHEQDIFAKMRFAILPGGMTEMVASA